MADQGWEPGNRVPDEGAVGSPERDLRVIASRIDVALHGDAGHLSNWCVGRLVEIAEQLSSTAAEVARLREAINRIGNLEWIIAPWHDAARVGQEFHWRVNVRDEPSLSKTSQTYTGTSFVGPTPADAALAALTTLAAGEAEG